jgi:hypothetical protein
LQVEYKMHAEEMMRRPGIRSRLGTPERNPLVRRPLTYEMRLGAAFVETLGHRAREFPDANRLRPTHTASVVPGRAYAHTGGEGWKSFASLSRSR